MPSQYARDAEIISLRTQLAAVTAERDELQAKLEVESASETCVECNQQWNPSLIESGSCIFCIQNETKSQLTTATARLAEAERDGQRLREYIEAWHQLDALDEFDDPHNFQAVQARFKAARAAIDQATAAAREG